MIIGASKQLVISCKGVDYSLRIGPNYIDINSISYMTDNNLHDRISKILGEN